jgi:hypothetical protein
VELVSSLLYVYLNGTVDDFDITIINVPHLDNNLQVSPHAISVYIPYAIGHIRRFYNAIISSSLDLIFMALLGVLVLLLLFLFFAWFSRCQNLIGNVLHLFCRNNGRHYWQYNVRIIEDNWDWVYVCWEHL